MTFADPTGLVFVSCSAILEGINYLGDTGDAGIQGVEKGTALRAWPGGQGARALRTSPSAAVRSSGGWLD